jgi:hypothetical protein
MEPLAHMSSAKRHRIRKDGDGVTSDEHPQPTNVFVHAFVFTCDDSDRLLP